jgi:hypothetical protein
VPASQVRASPEGFTRFAPWISGLFDCTAQGAGQQDVCMVQLLDARCLLEAILPGIEAAAAATSTATAPAPAAASEWGELAANH